MLTAMLVLTLGFVAAGVGDIKTTTSPCDAPVNENHYEEGETVYIHASGFDLNTEYSWDITGGKGGSSCDPGMIVASGIKMTDMNGGACFAAYTILEGDCGEYKVNFGGKNDNYRVNGPPAQVPEFGTMIGILTALGALGVFFLVRRK